METRKRLLIVDDEESFTKLLKLNLEATGAYEVRTENDGARALEVAREFRPDLFILDIVMPNVDGGEVVARLRGDPELKDIPVVFLTAIVSKAELDGDARRIHGIVYIAKPVSHEKLVEVIEAQLGRGGDTPA